MLRPGGQILITTPNVLRWDNLWALFRGANIYDRYHGNGIYGRHNREYTPEEISERPATRFVAQFIGKAHMIELDDDVRQDATGAMVRLRTYRELPEATLFRLRLEAAEAALPGAPKIVTPGDRHVKDVDLWLSQPFAGGGKR